MFLILCYINILTNETLFSLLLEILGNMCIAIVCFPEYHVITFQINLIFLIQVVFQLDQKSQNTKLNILGTKRAFEVK